MPLKCRQAPLCSTVGGPFSRRTGNYTMTSRLYDMCVEWARNRPVGWPLLHRTRHRYVRRRRRAKFVKYLSELFLHTSVPIRQKKEREREKRQLLSVSLPVSHRSSALPHTESPRLFSVYACRRVLSFLPRSVDTRLMSQPVTKADNRYSDLAPASVREGSRVAVY